MSAPATHPLVGKIVRWSHGPNVLVGPATRYDQEDDELFIIPDGLIHGHYWVPAKACTEHASTAVGEEREQPSGADVLAAAREYHERVNGTGSFDAVTAHVRSSLIFRMGCALRAAQGPGLATATGRR